MAFSWICASEIFDSVAIIIQKWRKVKILVELNTITCFADRIISQVKKYRQNYYNIEDVNYRRHATYKFEFVKVRVDDRTCIDVEISDAFNCLENLPTVLMILGIAGPSCRGIYHRGFGGTLSQRISIIPKLQHPCAHLWPSPLNNSSISSGLTALSSGDSWPESRTIIPWAETEHLKFPPLTGIKTRGSSAEQILPHAKFLLEHVT